MNRFSSRRRGVAVLPEASPVTAALIIVLTGLLVGTTTAQASIGRTETMLRDFVFNGERIVYELPPLGQVRFQLTSENDVRIDSLGSGLDSEHGTWTPGFDPRLRITSGASSAALGSDDSLLVFGSLPAAADTETAGLVGETLAAMQGTDDQVGFQFLLTDKAAVGVDALLYQSFGIYAHVAGLDVADWISQYGGSAAKLAVLADPDADKPTTAPDAETPTPATLLLILAGLFVLRFAHHRGAIGRVGSRRCVPLAAIIQPPSG